VRRLGYLLGGALAVLATDAVARPVAPQRFCAIYDASPWCSGHAVGCDMCHTSTGPAAWNVYGDALRAEIETGLPNDAFLAELEAALGAVEGDDSDGDGVSNVDEIHAGAFPGDEHSVPGDPSCPDDVSELDYPICRYSRRHVFRKVHLDFCGSSPSYDELLDFVALDEAAQDAALHAALDTCLDSEFWLGKDGVVWKMAHDKVRPVGSLKAGEDALEQDVPRLADYYNDYELFVWSHIDDHDVRSVLTADFFVERDENPTTYTAVPEVTDDCVGCAEVMQPERRNGMMTTRWYMGYFVMFTPLPRAAAAQAYRSYLGYDIARSEGLDNPIAGEPKDYDNKGVDAPTCAVCHSTLDPLMYAFRNYNGIDGPARYQYVPGRLEFLYPADLELQQTPESGWILGEPYQDLNQWAQIAADSDDFAVAVVRDYWRLLVGRDPLPEEAEEFAELWGDLRGKHDYGVERMLHDFIMTEAYGAP
jgi:hypothetical protein